MIWVDRLIKYLTQVDIVSILNKLSHFFFGTLPSIIVNGLIFSLFLIGLAIILKGFLRTWLEGRALKKVSRIFDRAEKHETEEVLDAVQSARISPKRYVYRAIRAVQNVKGLDGKVEMLGESFRETYAPHSSWSRYIAGILILLGLMGTIVGLSEAIINLRSILSGMGGDIERDTFEKMIKEILGSLSFMETAFSTTFCGFIFFLILSFLDHVYLRAEEAFLKVFEAFNSNVLIPFFTPRQAENSLASLTNILKGATSSLIEVSGGIRDLVQMVTSNQEIYLKLADTLHGTVGDVGVFQKELAGRYGKLEQMTQEFIRLSGELTEERKENKVVIQDLFEKLGTDKNEIERLYNRLEGSVRRLETSFAESLTRATGNMKVAADHQDQQIQQLGERHDATLKATGEKIVELMGQADKFFQAEHEVFSRALHDVTTKLEKGFLEVLSKVSEVVKGVLTRQEGLLEGSKSLLADTKAEIEGTLKLHRESYQQDFSKAIEGIKASVKSLTDSQKPLMKSLKEGVDKISAVELPKVIEIRPRPGVIHRVASEFLKWVNRKLEKA